MCGACAGGPSSGLERLLSVFHVAPPGPAPALGEPSSRRPHHIVVTIYLYIDFRTIFLTDSRGNGLFSPGPTKVQGGPGQCL